MKGERKHSVNHLWMAEFCYPQSCWIPLDSTIRRTKAEAMGAYHNHSFASKDAYEVRIVKFVREERR